MAEVIDFSLVFSVPVVMGVGRLAGGKGCVAAGRDGRAGKGLSRVGEGGSGMGVER